MNRKILLVTLCAATALSGCGTQPEEPASTQTSPATVQTVPAGTGWQQFASTAGRFSILMPGIPEERKSVINTDLGPIDDHSFMLKTHQDGRKTAYLLSYSDYPPGHTQKFDPHDFLERTWQGSFGNLGNRLVYKKRISSDGFAGLEFQYRGKGASTSLVTARNYLVNDRIYQMSAIMSEDQVKAGYATKFLDSFKLLK